MPLADCIRVATTAHLSWLGVGLRLKPFVHHIVYLVSRHDVSRTFSICKDLLIYGRKVGKGKSSREEWSYVQSTEEAVVFAKQTDYEANPDISEKCACEWVRWFQGAGLQEGFRVG